VLGTALRRTRRWQPGARSPRWSPVAVAGVCALGFALLVEVSPVAGGDLVAQEYWASWASAIRTPVDLGWYGGLPVASYSLLGPWAGALLGLPLAGILATVLGAASTTVLLGRLRPVPARWTAAGVASAAMWAANEWTGRTTFGLGAALGCLALVVAGGPWGRRGRVAGAILGVLAGATSPVASVFLVVAAAAWWWGEQSGITRLRPRPLAPWLVAGGALLPVGAARLLGGVSGPQPASAHQMLAALAATGVTAVVLPPGYRTLRAGLTCTAGLLAATWLIGSPVGSNSTRLVLLFAIPVVVAVARTRPAATLLAALAIAWLLPPVVVADLMPRHDPSISSTQALLAQLRHRGPVGRIEVVPEKSHEESVSVARGVPLARGWLRQLDTVRAGLFYDGSLDAAEYVRWLRADGISYVALSSGPLDWPSGGEARLLRRGVPGLRQVWSDRGWRLFEVSDSGVVRGNGTLVSSDRSRLVVDVPRPGRVEVALRWSRWSSVSGPGGCIRRSGRDGWTTLRADRPGRYVVTSAWRPSGQC
jgi:hypothetical protein